MLMERIIAAASVKDIHAHLAAEDEIFLIYDENAAWVASEVIEALPSVKGSIAIEASEELKSMDTVLGICRSLLKAGASRRAFVLAVGGGITTDLSGFAASIYKRGIRYANLPTTLLAQVDAAIGGKTGVNLDGYKNMLGVIVLPEFTFICPEVLKTLPPREYKCGAAELLKTFLIGDAAAYSEAVGALSAGGPLGALIGKAAAIKEGIVSRDLYEKGERRILNLGHTFAHAIEHEARRRGDDIAHGEAVSMGIILAAKLSDSLGVSKASKSGKSLAAQLEADWRACGLPVECPYPLADLAAAMLKDKKAVGDGVAFVLPVAPGEVHVRNLAPAAAAQQFGSQPLND